MSAMVISGGAAVPRGQMSGHANKMRTEELYIHLYSHKLQLQKQEIKETKKKRHTTCQRKQSIKYVLTTHSGSAR